MVARTGGNKINRKHIIIRSTQDQRTGSNIIGSKEKGSDRTRGVLSILMSLPALRCFLAQPKRVRGIGKYREIDKR